MTAHDLLERREAFDFEFKAAQGRDGKGAVPNSIWQTYSAFANTDGGYIVLGAEEGSDGMPVPTGIKDPDRVLRDFWSTANNTAKVSINLLSNSDVSIVESGSEKLIVIRVPRADRKSRPVFVDGNVYRGTYRRQHEGDYLCNEEVVRRMISDSEHDARDNRLLEGYDLSDVDDGSLSGYRNLFRSAKPGHAWLEKDDVELLRMLGGWRRDRETGAEGLTLAGLLMFGKQAAIEEAVPHYMVDYQELSPEQGGSVRWTDRIIPDGTWSGNLFGFFRRVYGRLISDLKVPFRLQHGHQRVDETPVHEAIREALVNTFVHADYSATTPILVTKEAHRLTFRNPGGLRIPIERVFAGGISDCRNPSLQKMFLMIGAAEKAGSGFPKILYAWKSQHWRFPLLDESVEPETTTLTLSMVSLLPQWALDELEARFGSRFYALREMERLSLATALVEGRVSNQRLQQLTDVHPADLTSVLRSLTSDGFLRSGGQGRGRVYALPPLDADVGLVLSEQPPHDALVLAPSGLPARNSTESEQSSTESEQSSTESEQSSTETERSSTESDVDTEGGDRGQLDLDFGSAAQLREIAAPHRGRNLPRELAAQVIVEMATVRPVSKQEISDLLAKSVRTIEEYITELLDAGRITRIYENPNDPRQAYRAVQEQEENS
jgi:ATP-dependent DNA helicase RecG